MKYALLKQITTDTGNTASLELCTGCLSYVTRRLAYVLHTEHPEHSTVWEAMREGYSIRKVA